MAQGLSQRSRRNYARCRRESGFPAARPGRLAVEPHPRSLAETVGISLRSSCLVAAGNERWLTAPSVAEAVPPVRNEHQPTQHVHRQPIDTRVPRLLASRRWEHDKRSTPSSSPNRWCRGLRGTRAWLAGVCRGDRWHGKVHHGRQVGFGHCAIRPVQLPRDGASLRCSPCEGHEIGRNDRLPLQRFSPTTPFGLLAR